MSKEKIVTTINNEELPITKCRKFEGGYYKIGENNTENSGDCYLIDSKYYRMETGQIVFDHETKEYVDFLSEMFEVNILDRNPKVTPDLILFTGGEDVNPNIYSENVGEFTILNKERDEIERDMYFDWNHVPKLGIGRGAQLIAVSKGCSLIQHIVGHEETNHRIATSSSRNYDIESNHHQLIYPFDLSQDRYKLLAWSKYFRSDIYLNGDNKDINLHRDFLEVEVIQFDNELCIQAHPETSANLEFRSYCLRLIKSVVDTKTKSKSYNDEFEPYNYEEDYGWNTKPTIPIINTPPSTYVPRTGTKMSQSFKTHLQEIYESNYKFGTDYTIIDKSKK